MTVNLHIWLRINFLIITKWVGHSSTKMIEQVHAHLSPEFKNNEMHKRKRPVNPVRLISMVSDNLVG